MGIGTAKYSITSKWLKLVVAFLEKSENSKYLIFILLISSAFFAFYGTKSEFPDEYHYKTLADSILVGKYSSWYWLPIDLPDTLRTFGYPAFLVLFRWATDADAPVFFVQYVLYLTAVWLFARLAAKSSRVTLNVFLLLVTFNVQIPYYAGQISAEILAIFFIAIWCALEFSSQSEKKKIVFQTLVLVLLYYVKPVYIYFPLLYWIYQWLKNKQKGLIMLSVLIFAAGISPYVIFNLNVHNTLKLTPLEGGGGVVHIGFWQHKLPGYHTKNYFIHNMGLEPVRFIEENELERNIRLYESEWKRINEEIRPFFSVQDQIADSLMKAADVSPFMAYSSEFTKARENALKSSIFRSIREEPVYYTKTRVYTAIRQWITGINLKLLASPAVLDKVKALTPFLVTFITFGMGFPYLIVQILRNRNLLDEYLSWIIMIGYTSLIHVPMSIQSRYTVPVHLVFLSLLAFKLAAKLRHTSQDAKR